MGAESHAIAYLDLRRTLNVVAEPVGEPRKLHSAEDMTAPDGTRLNWAPNKLLISTEDEPTLLNLSA